MKPFDSVMFYEAMRLLIDAKAMGLGNLGLARIRLEADTLSAGILPSLTLYGPHGDVWEYEGDDFHDGLVALRRLIANARAEM